MEYKSYQHVEKLGNSEVENILDGKVYLFYKIDGTNGCIFLNDQHELDYGSRKRWLKDDLDNQEFKYSIKKDIELYHDLSDYLINHPKHIIYGEWLVKSTLTTYKDDAWKNFYVFDILDTETNTYVPYDVYKKEFDSFYPHIKYIPLLACLDNPTEDIVKSYLKDTGKFLIKSGLGEGIVIKRYDFVNRYGRTTWAKVLTEDYLSVKHSNRTKNSTLKTECKVEYDIAKKFTNEQISKEYNKLVEDKGSWDKQYIGELITRCFIEFWRDNWEIILNEFHYPIINFKKLKQLCAQKVVDYLKV